MRLGVALFGVLFFAGSVGFCGAREHFINGRESFENGSYTEAADAFEKAYALDPKPAFLFNIAQCLEKLGRLEEAITYLNRFLDEDQQKIDTALVQQKIDALRETIRATGITVTCAEDEATIYVDDRPVGITPLETVIALPEGMYEVQVSKPGFEPFTMNVGVSSGYSVPIYATLEPRPEIAAPVGPMPLEETPSAPGAEKDEGETRAAAAWADDESSSLMPSVEKKERDRRDVIPWVLAGGGAALAIVGFVGIGTVAYVENDKTLAHLSDAMGWPGVAVAVGGATWGVVRLVKKKKDNETALVVPFVDRRTAGIATAVTF